MSAIVNNLRLKIARAETHFVEFQTAVFRNPSPDKAPHPPALYHDPNRQGIFAKPHDGPEPQLEWGIILGDVFHQLRACLDHMLYAIAAGRRPLTTSEARNLQFPVFVSSDDFNADWRASQDFWERVIGADALAEVKLAQPYQRCPQAPPADALWQLHKLDPSTNTALCSSLRTGGTCMQEPGATSRRSQSPS